MKEYFQISELSCSFGFGDRINFLQASRKERKSKRVEKGKKKGREKRKRGRRRRKKSQRRPKNDS